jgi:signal transduction histidine kinase
VIETGLADDDLAVLAEGVTFISRLVGADRARLSVVDLAGALTPIVHFPAGTLYELPETDRLDIPVVFDGESIGLLELAASGSDGLSLRSSELAAAFAPLLGTVLGEARRHHAKDAFFALTIHELRTPLTAASGFVQTIVDHADRLQQDVVQDLLVRIVHNHRRLTQLVDDLADLLRLEGGQLRVHVAPVEVEPLLAELLRITDVEGRIVDLEVAAGLPRVVADGGRLEQVVANLLSNAVKFSPPDGHIVLRATAHHGTVDVEVIDQGEGIPPQIHDQIFDAYFQGATASGGRPKGLGIGLFLVRRLCQLMGATVRVDSAPGQGSTFTVRLQPA